MHDKAFTFIESKNKFDSIIKDIIIEIFKANSSYKEQIPILHNAVLTEFTKYKDEDRPLVKNTLELSFKTTYKYCLVFFGLIFRNMLKQTSLLLK